MARKEAMADIANYLAGTEAPRVRPVAKGPGEVTNTPDIEPLSASAIPDVSQQEETEEERASIVEMQAVQQEAARQRTEESDVAQQLRGTAQSLNDTRARIGDGISTGLSNIVSGLAAIPLPGTVLLPLSILLLFFFALLPVNGQTRLMWLWLVLSGNAHLTGETLPTAVVTTPVSTPLSGTNTITPLATTLTSPTVTNTGPAAPPTNMLVPVLKTPLPTILPFRGVGEP